MQGIPSLAVLRWAATELHPYAQQNATAAQKLQGVQARIADLEGKMQSGTLKPEMYKGALEVMGRCQCDGELSEGVVEHVGVEGITALGI